MSRRQLPSRGGNLDEDNAFVDLERSAAARAAAQRSAGAVSAGGGAASATQLFIGGDSHHNGAPLSVSSKATVRIALSRAVNAQHKQLTVAQSNRDARITKILQTDNSAADHTATLPSSKNGKRASVTAPSAGSKRGRIESSVDEGSTAVEREAAANVPHAHHEAVLRAATPLPPTLLTVYPSSHDDAHLFEEQISTSLGRFLDGDVVFVSGTAISTVPTSLTGIPITSSFAAMSAPSVDCIEVPCGPHATRGLRSGELLGSREELEEIIQTRKPNPRKSTPTAASATGVGPSTTVREDQDLFSLLQVSQPYVWGTTGPSMGAARRAFVSSVLSSTSVAAVAGSALPGQLCSVCWLPAPYLCPKCGVARFCCVECGDVHEEMRCNKFVV